MNYDLVNGVVKNFEFKLADWGTAGQNEDFYGGTPGYVSKKMFSSLYKDHFSIGRVAMELFVSKIGKVEKKFCLWLSWTNLVWTNLV